MPTIRTATPTDAEAIATIHVQSWQHTYRDLLPPDKLAALSIEERTHSFKQFLAKTESLHYLVAEQEGEVIGFAGWGPTDQTTAMLYSIYLSPRSMGMGTGSTLLTSVEDGMIAAGVTSATLHVLQANYPTRRFYERHAWRLVPESEQDEHFYGITMQTVVYAKSLLCVVDTNQQQ